MRTCIMMYNVCIYVPNMFVPLTCHHPFDSCLGGENNTHPSHLHYGLPRRRCKRISKSIHCSWSPNSNRINFHRPCSWKPGDLRRKPESLKVLLKIWGFSSEIGHGKVSDIWYLGLKPTNYIHQITHAQLKAMHKHALNGLHDPIFPTPRSLLTLHHLNPWVCQMKNSSNNNNNNKNNHNHDHNHDHNHNHNQHQHQHRQPTPTPTSTPTSTPTQTPWTWPPVQMVMSIPNWFQLAPQATPLPWCC